MPVPPPVNNVPVNPIKDEDLYDPLKAEDEDEEEKEKESDVRQEKHSTVSKPTIRTFNIKKEHSIKIEASK